MQFISWVKFSLRFLLMVVTWVNTTVWLTFIFSISLLRSIWNLHHWGRFCTQKCTGHKSTYIYLSFFLMVLGLSQRSSFRTNARWMSLRMWMCTSLMPMAWPKKKAWILDSTPAPKLTPQHTWMILLPFPIMWAASTALTVIAGKPSTLKPKPGSLWKVHFSWISQLFLQIPLQNSLMCRLLFPLNILKFIKLR